MILGKKIRFTIEAMTIAEERINMIALNIFSSIKLLYHKDILRILSLHYPSLYKQRRD